MEVMVIGPRRRPRATVDGDVEEAADDSEEIANGTIGDERTYYRISGIVAYQCA